LSQIAKQVGDRKSTGLVEELASRASACIVGEPGLIASEPAEGRLQCGEGTRG
jgi:hypothetical protein